MRRFFTSCDGATESFLTSGTILVDATSFGMVEHAGALSDQEIVADADDRMAEGLSLALRD